MLGGKCTHMHSKVTLPKQLLKYVQNSVLIPRIGEHEQRRERAPCTHRRFCARPCCVLYGV